MFRAVAADNVTQAKIISLILGAVVLGLGLQSYLTSSWVKHIHLLGTSYPFYKICTVLKSALIIDNYARSCPDIIMERYFVLAIITCFALSVFFFVADLLTKRKFERLMLFDAGYHILGGVALVVAGLIYLVSAIQIHYLTKDFVSIWESIGLNDTFQFRYLEKRIAAGLAILHGAFMITVARYILQKLPFNDARDMNREVVAQPRSNFSYANQNLAYGGPPPSYLQSVNYETTSVPPPTYEQTKTCGASPPPPYRNNVNCGVASVFTT